MISEHYFFEISGKDQDDHFSYKTALRTTLFNFFHLAGENFLWLSFLDITKIFSARISIFSFILMNGGIIYLVGVFLSFAFANLILSIIVLRTKAYKNIFTAFSGIKKNKEINKEIITNSFSAIVMPSAAFFSKDSFKPSRILSARQETEKKFKKFSFWNSFLFFVVGNITKSIV